MISNGGTATLGLYDFKKQLDAFGGVDYFRSTLVGGYTPNARVMLTNGEIVQNSTNGNLTNDPNVEMTGWVKENSASQVFQSNGLSQESRNSQDPTILDFFTKSELNAFNSNPNMDCTAIIKRAFSNGAKRINFLDLQLHVTLETTGVDTLATFTDGDIELYGNGATLIDDTAHTNNGAIVAMFTLSNGVKSFKSNLNYIGQPISVATEIGYKGGTYVFSKGQNRNIEVNARLKNIRYGILAGNYSDPSLGGHKGIRGNLQCDTVGYPIATYLADDIEITITGDTFHRVSYISGCNYARVTALTKNYYIASVACVFSDAKTGEGASKGCTDCKCHIVDQGSTAYVANSWLCGISLSRVDPNTVYDNIEFYAEVRGVGSTVANTLGAFIVNSTVKNTIPSYPSNWIPEIKLNNIRFSGLIDRSAQTGAEHTIGDVYIHTADEENNGTTSLFQWNDIEYRKGSGTNTRSLYVLLRGLVGKAFFNNVNFPDNAVFLYGSNGTSKTYFDLCRIRGLSTGGTDLLPNTTCVFDKCDIYGGLSYILQTNKTFINTPVGSTVNAQITTVSNELTLSGPTVTWAGALPVNSLILGVSFVITEEIVGTEGLFIGDTSTAGRFFNSTLVALGAGLSISNATGLQTITTGTQNIVLRGRGAGGTQAPFTSGKVKVVVNYIKIPVPTV